MWSRRFSGSMASSGCTTSTTSSSSPTEGYLPPPKAGTQPAYITLSGGQGAAIADVAADARLNVLDFPPAVVERLRPLFGGGGGAEPCDAWGLGWDPEWFGRLLDGLLAAPEIDPIVLSLDVPATGHA